MWQFLPIYHTLLRHKFGVLLLVVQIAFCIAIFSNMAFVSRQLREHVNRMTGFDERQLFSVSVRPLKGFISYAQAQRDMADMRAMAGVEQVAATRWVPLAGLSFQEVLRTSPEDTIGYLAATSEVSPQIFATLGLRLIAGRGFAERDMAIKTANSQLPLRPIIITAALADLLFGRGKNAVGKSVYQDGAVREIIGVSDNWLGFMLAFNEKAEKTVFYPGYSEMDGEHRYLVRVVDPQRMASISEAVIEQLRRNYNKDLLLWVDTIDDAKLRSNSQSQVIVHLFMVLMAILGFVIAFAISGQTLFWITQRTKQIGIRRALGASRQAIVVHVLLENLMIFMPGLALGIAASLALNQVVMRTTATLPMSPLFLLVTCGLLLVVSLASAAIPAWRASKISPSLASHSV